MVTQLGKFLRDLRLDSGELIKEMATKLNVSSSFLLAVENGKKKMPESWYEKIISSYNLDKGKQDEFEKTIKNSKRLLKINRQDLNKKKRSLSFEKTLKNINKEEVDKMKIFLTNN